MVRGVDARKSVGRTLLSADVDLGVDFDLPSDGKNQKLDQKLDQKQRQGQRTGVSALHKTELSICSAITDNVPGRHLN